MVRSILFVELGMNWNSDFEREAMRGCQPVAKNKACNKSALDSFSIFDGDITPVNEGLFLGISLRIGCCAAAKQRDQGLKIIN